MNEIVQQTKFLKSRLNWDADIPLLGEGESKYFLNTVPEESEHAGARTNCLGTTQTTLYIPNASFTTITVTATTPSTSTERFEFTLASVPAILELEITLNDELKHLYISSTGYATITLFCAYVITQVRKHYENDLSSYGAITNGCYFVFNVISQFNTDMQVRARAVATYPTTLKVIGSYYDNLTDNTYYWVFDTASNIMLLQYVNYDNVIINIPVISSGYSSLALNKDSYVSNPFIVGSGKNRLLYWCYYNGNTYKINIYRHLVIGGAGSALSTNNINLIKIPPLSDISISYTDSVTGNNANRYFQALARTRFLDGETSVFGTISPLLYPASYGENSIGVRGKLSNKVYNLTVSRYTPNSEISKLEYAIQYGTNIWALSDLEISSSTVNHEVVLLTGDEPSSDIAPSEIVRLFDYVPQKHGNQHIINNNRIVLTDCTEGFDNVDISATVVYSETSGYGSTPTAYVNCAFSGGGPYTATVTPLTVSATEWRTHCIYIKFLTREYYAYVVDDYGKTQINLCDSLVEALTYEIANNYEGIDVGTIIPARSGSTVSIAASSASVTCRYLIFRSYVKEKTIKHGATPYFGLVYKDQFGRCGGVNPVPESLFARSNIDLPATATISVSNNSPSWAHTCQLFYGGTDILTYKQAIIKRDDIDILPNSVKIFINNYVINSQVVNSASNMASYMFNPGDKLIFIGYKADSTASIGGQTFTFSSITAFSSLVSHEILSQDEAAIYIQKPSNKTLLSEIVACTHCLIEVYTPRKEKPVEYKETPYVVNITTPGGTLDDSFEVSFDHFINQTFYVDDGIPVSSWITSESFSNYFESKTLGLGRVNFYNPDFKALRRNIVRASNVYIPNTNINGLSTFEYANEVVVDESYGPITDVKLVGDVLKIIQSHKISSMYLGAEMGVDASGNAVLLSSNKILTTPRYNALGYGSLHPESIVVHNQYTYALDVVNSVVWRDTPGGTYAISDNAMRSYFKYKIRQLVDSCGYSFKAFGAYDYLNEMYFITFKDPYNSTNNETIGFHEPTESWYSFYSFTPEAYCGIPGDYMLSFNAGKLYVHNNATRNNFYSTQYTSKVWIVGNQYPDDPKKWNSLSVNSNDIWAPSDNDGIIVDSDSIAYQDPKNYTTHRGGMQSSLKKANFRYYNNEFRVDFLRDGTTSSSAFYVPNLFNGRVLTGKTILIKLINDNTSAVYLRGVRINAQTVR